MKYLQKILAVVCLFALCASFIACGSTEVEYYTNTNVTTFTCVTGIDGYLSQNSEPGMRIYTYDCADSKKESLAKKYIRYLKSKQGYTSVSSDDDYAFVTLANDDWGVVVDTTQSGAVNILPYHRSY